MVKIFHSIFRTKTHYFFLIIIFFTCQSCLFQSEKGEIILTQAKPSEGFNYPYFLYIPEGASLKDELVLIVEPNNSGFVDDDLAKHTEKAKRTASRGFYIGNYVAQTLKLPLLVPVFPRPESQWRVYTHALDRDVILLKNNPLERIDLQLLAMVEDAENKLTQSGYTLHNKFFMTGFSASGTFTNRFTLIHPDKILASAAGGLNGLLMLPIDSLNGQPLDYPLGISDFEAIFGKAFDQYSFIKTPQFYFMGANDENDAIPYEDAFNQDERAIIYRVFGEKMLPTRWEKCALVYEHEGVNATIKTFKDMGHEHPDKIKQEVAEFFKKILK